MPDSKEATLRYSLEREIKGPILLINDKAGWCPLQGLKVFCGNGCVFFEVDEEGQTIRRNCSACGAEVRELHYVEYKKNY
jgi:hypothetical protein